MKRGDIVVVDLPQPAGAGGSEQVGKRPALVVHADATSAVLSVVMIIPLTSQMNALRFPHTIEVLPSAANGLDCRSVLLVFQLRAIDKGRVGRVVGHLESAILADVDQHMRQLLDL